MRNFLDKCKAFFSKVGKGIQNIFQKKNMQTALNFVVTNKRYFYAGLLFIVLIIILVSCTGEKWRTDSGTESTEAGELDFTFDAEFEQDKYEDVNNLIANYFTAYAAVDIDTLSQYAYPISDNEASYISVYSNYVESYENISCYTMHGYEEGSYFVSVYYENKFYDIDTTSPSLDFFYVETDADGNLYINNLYRPYYMDHPEDRLDEIDDNILYLINQYAKQDAVVELQSQVNAAYNDAVASDEALHTMVTTTLPASIRVWADSLVAAETATEETTEAAEEVESTEEAVPEETTEAAEAEEEEAEEETTVSVKVTAGSVNVREEADQDSDRVGKASKGDIFTKLGESGDWTQIDYNGTTAYIKTEFVEVVE